MIEDFDSFQTPDFRTPVDFDPKTQKYKSLYDAIIASRKGVYRGYPITHVLWPCDSIYIPAKLFDDNASEFDVYELRLVQAGL